MTAPDHQLTPNPLLALCSVSTSLWAEAWFDAANDALEWFWRPMLEWFQPDPTGTRFLDVPNPID